MTEAEAKEFLEEVRLIHRTFDKAENLFLLKDMPVHLSIDGPIDVAWTENELRRSREHGLDDPSWGFLTERSPKFPPTNNNEQNQPTLIENAYMTFSECDEYSGSPDHQEEMNEESVGYKVKLHTYVTFLHILFVYICFLVIMYLSPYWRFSSALGYFCKSWCTILLPNSL